MKHKIMGIKSVIDLQPIKLRDEELEDVSRFSY